MKISDLHTHSSNSFDAQNTVFEMCESAINCGLYAIAITDHCEAPMINFGDNCEYGDLNTLIPKSIKETNEAKHKYAGKIKVLTGIELGEPMHDQECTKRALSYGEYDFILASVHNLRNMPDFYFIDYSKHSIDKILKLYFNELAETAGFEHFDSLAHLTYPLRYIKAKLGIVPDLTPYYNTIDEIFNILISNNKALEVNVSGLFKDLGTTLPDRDLIKRFKDLGGKYITLGTDSHNTDSVGKGLKNGLKTVTECGFDSYTIFEKHQPKLIKIDL